MRRKYSGNDNRCITYRWKWNIYIFMGEQHYWLIKWFCSGFRNKQFAELYPGSIIADDLVPENSYIRSM